MWVLHSKRNIKYRRKTQSGSIYIHTDIQIKVYRDIYTRGE